MKRQLSVLFSLILCLTLLSGCSMPSLMGAAVRLPDAPGTETTEPSSQSKEDSEPKEQTEEPEEKEEPEPSETPIAEETDTYTTEWDSSDVYADPDAWEQDYQKASAMVDDLGKYKGTLNSAQGIYDFVREVYDGELAELMEKLQFYPQLLRYKDTSNTDALTMLAKWTQLSQKKAEALAYVDEEIFSMTQEEREKVFSDPILEPYAYSLRSYTDPDTVQYSEEAVEVISKVSPLWNRGYSLYQTMIGSCIPAPEVTAPDGTKLTANYSGYIDAADSDYDQEFKKEFAEIFYASQMPYQDIMAQILNAAIEENLAIARLEGFDSYLEYALKQQDIEPEVYENIKTTAHEMLPDVQRYFEQVKDNLGTGHLYIFDTISASGTEREKISYEQSCEDLLSALSVLGEDYVENVRKALTCGHIDVYPASGKTQGGFEMTCHVQGIYPYILLNYSNSDNSTDTLCHEMGHFMYEYYSTGNSNLNRLNQGPTTFTHEVASTNNEFLFMNYKTDQARSEEDRLYYTQMKLNLIFGSVIRQMMYSEFEQYLYETVENGGALTAENMNSKWMELNREYYGDTVEFPEGFEWFWMNIPHFYYGMYVYKYATSCTYAAATSEKILSGDKDALESYLNFLTLGGSDTPANLLKEAGIDVVDDAAYQYIKDYFKESVDSYCELTK